MLLVMTALAVVPAVGALAFGLWLRRELGADRLARTACRAVVINRSSCRRAERAACIPLMPWTPPPGGVDDEHR